MKYLLVIFSFLNATTSFSQKADGELFRANEFYRNGQYQQAEQYYQSVLNRDAANRTDLFNLANTYYQQKRYDEALRILDQFPDGRLKAASLYNKGVVHTRQKELLESIEAYKSALRISPYNMPARENLQKALRELKQQQEQQKRQQQKNQNMNNSEAERRMQELQEKEEQIRERMRNRGQKGAPMPKDW
jgi:tetratricopeptide (TPR) repeat protein